MAAHRDHLLPAPHEIPGPTSPQSSLLAGRQRYVLFPTFPLESGVVLHNVPVAFKTWGQLAHTRDNALVVCHALTGSADVEDWWGPLLGKDKVFDYTRFFIVCCNVLGSPYGSASPCTQSGGETSWAQALQSRDHIQLQNLTKHKNNSNGQGWWGPEFPPTTVRDDVRIHKLVLEYLGVHSIAAVVGGSMGGMAVLEWPLVFPTRFPSSSASPSKSYISAIVPLATSARHSAWCISWAEAQRQSIYSDPQFKHGYYAPHEPPRNGLAAARMAALLTYRSRDSFESRFGRRVGKALKGTTTSTTTSTSGGGGGGGGAGGGGRVSGLPPKSEEEHTKQQYDQRPRSVAAHAAAAHNEGNRSPPVQAYSSYGSYGSNSPTTNASSSYFSAASLSPTATTPPVPETPHPAAQASDESRLEAAKPNVSLIEPFSPSTAPQIFSAQSYLRYQGDKFVKRFDANCYIHLTRKMDTHDVARSRWGWSLEPLRREVGEKPQSNEDEDRALINVLSFLADRGDDQQGGTRPPAVLVVSIESDGLFAPPEQVLIHKLVHGSELVNVQSTDGHDGFLLEFQQINSAVSDFLKRKIGYIYQRSPLQVLAPNNAQTPLAAQDAVNQSVFGEVQDVTRW